MENKRDSKLFKIIISAVAALNFILSIILMCIVIVNNNKNKKNNESIKYTLYIGTNDKDTYEPVADIDTCISKVTKICVSFTDGCTIYEAKGYWKDENNQITVESTIVAILEDVDKTIVYKICDKVIEELNQNSILIETNNVSSEFYHLNN